MRSIYSLLFVVWIFITACNKPEVAPVEMVKGLDLPDHFPSPVYDFSANPYKEEIFLLGRDLFYEPKLSANNTIACGSCHLQSNAFTHHGHNVSHGINDQLGKRNALPLFNLAWQPIFFWDGGVPNLDLTSLNALHSPVEMDERIENVLIKLAEDEKYPTRFEEAFGNAEITSQRFLQALSQFMYSMISSQSKFDKVQLGEASFWDDELKGQALFEQKCSPCHAGVLLTDFSFRNNGLPINHDFERGREEITLSEADRGKFKVPSLRNIAVTGPYMHDGRFRTLRQVLDFYSTGVQSSETLDPLLQAEDTPGIALSEIEKTQLIAFLETLTDYEFIRDKRFSETNDDFTK
ncbi:cytochrome c peroxidase [Cytophagales bacterium LB-30]|uniref:Cytochrome c peroxidase n=1 Tax=Shiella aurantiaca TaxID=3058365 RepID=A0ABT8F4M9_9BACT|nr:cytochrome c peroxidase [Shiella aurantiaca]MDN4165417.1 cytochrome c peroxidase [Shiella aurantiaca]